MDADLPELDLDTDVVTLTRALCDIPSVSHQEQELADRVERALRGRDHLQVERVGNTVVARTDLGHDQRVVLAGHIDTVPLTDPPNLPVRVEGDDLVGRGTTDMKAGCAVLLRLAAGLLRPTRDVTYVLYDCEEVADEFNGLRRVTAQRPELLGGDFAVLLEPTDEGVEGGCNGNATVTVTTRGVASHSARPWKGHNAIHDLGEVLERIAAAQPAPVEVDGLTYRQSLNAVAVEGGVADNVLPDVARLRVNYRFAPDRSADEAVRHLREEVFAGLELDVVDTADGARPGLDRPAAADFVSAVGLPVRAKLGWTDVARFSALGVPAVNFGPGLTGYAHTDDERCPVRHIPACEEALRRWLS
jgi:succinyl-diaminopimelate desuccinylase